jgi:hypothetical protein
MEGFQFVGKELESVVVVVSTPLPRERKSEGEKEGILIFIY